MVAHDKDTQHALQMLYREQKILCTGQCGPQKYVECVSESFLLIFAQHVIDHIVEMNM
jgi:hypothetical protein